MKRRSICSIAILFVLFLLRGQGWASGALAGSDILYVAPGAVCSGTPNCYATIQEALAVAVAGVEIRVAAGTYTDLHDCPRNDVVTTGTTKALVCLDKSVTLSGGWDNTFTTHDMAVYPTTLSASGLGRVLYITGAVSPTVENLVINGGNPNGLGGYEYFGQFDVGGGVYVMTANATLRDNHIAYNSAPSLVSGGGAGVYLGQSNSLLLNNIIEYNTASNDGLGGGVFIYQGAPSLTGNNLNANSGVNGGGAVYIFDSSAVFTGNLFYQNSSGTYGGGMLATSCSPTLTGNRFHLNSGLWGGGLFLAYSNNGMLINNLFTDNTAVGNGSGLYIVGGAPTLLHTTLARNLGGDGSVVYLSPETPSTLTMTNSLLSDQVTGVFADTGNTVLLDGVLWYNNTANTAGPGSFTISHAYTGDPVLSPLDGYHLAPNSAAVNRGMHAGVLTDIDNQLRDFLPDLGADEYVGPGATLFLFLPLSLK